MDRENGFDRSRLKGYLFEIVVLELLQKRGYRNNIGIL